MYAIMVIDPSKTAKCNFYQNMADELTKKVLAILTIF